MDYRRPNFDFALRNYPQSPARLDPRTPIDRGRRPPRLVLPTPNAASPYSPYPQSLRSSKSPNLNGNPYLYPKETDSITGSKGKAGVSVGEKSTFWIFNKFSSLSRRWFTHCFLSIVLAIYTVGGAVIFSTVEGRGEELATTEFGQFRIDLINGLKFSLNSSKSNTSEKELEARHSKLILKFEESLIEAYEKKPLIISNRNQKIWTFFNSVTYCTTIFTTIGYGHLYPTTVTGQALTIVYAIIGIPLFLIALTDFGKLFTRCIKFFWSYVRRLYYTGSCRRARKTAHVAELFHGAQVVYEIATLRRPSIFTSIDPASLEDDPENPKSKDGSTLNSAGIGSDTPTTPAPSNFEIDDEFNLPISVAIIILVLYIFLGAVMYSALEEWNFLTAFYFVFISLSTIGFGDYVPKHPVCMVASIVYLVFGLALMSMCINVVQVKLSDTFKDASAKLGATIGLDVNEDDGSISTATATPSVLEVPGIHDAADKEVEEIEKKSEANGIKKEKKSSMKVKSKDNDNKENVDVDNNENTPKTPKEVKF